MTLWVRHDCRTIHQKVQYQPDFCIAPVHRDLNDAEALLRISKRVADLRRGREVLWLIGPTWQPLEGRDDGQQARL